MGCGPDYRCRGQRFEIHAVFQAVCQEQAVGMGMLIRSETWSIEFFGLNNTCNLSARRLASAT